MFQRTQGVLATQVGYMGGQIYRPTFEQVRDCRSMIHIIIIRRIHNNYDDKFITLFIILLLLFHFNQCKVCSGKTGHAEVVRLIFMPSIISYETLLSIFLSNIEPLNVDKKV